MDDKVKRLMTMYEQMRYDKKEAKIAAQRKFSPMIQEYVQNEVDRIERGFAVELVNALESGLTRSDIELPVLKSKGGRYKHFVELGGGTIREKLTPEERREKVLDSERRRLELNDEKRTLRDEVKESQKYQSLLKKVGLELSPAGSEHPYILTATGDSAYIELDEYVRALQGRKASIVTPNNPSAAWDNSVNRDYFNAAVRDVYLYDNPDKVIPDERRGKPE